MKIQLVDGTPNSEIIGSIIALALLVYVIVGTPVWYALMNGQTVYAGPMYEWAVDLFNHLTTRSQ